MDPDLLKYSCQVALPAFGEAGQEKLHQAKVLIVGTGGLGCPSAQYLTAAGIGTLGIADDDVVSLSNLHRQLLYTPDDIGVKKVVVAAKRLEEQNPLVRVIPFDERVTSENVLALVNQYDIVVDATDNFDTKYLLNDACVLSGKPLVYGAIYQYEGQAAVWNVRVEDGTYTPNYRDIFSEVDATQIPNCAEGGVLPTLAGIIGCIQANEVIKYITGTGKLLTCKLLLFDALTLESRIIKTGAQTKTSITTLKETEFLSIISVSNLKKGMEQGLYQLIDVRSAEERELFNIGGMHLPAREAERDLDYLNTGKPAVFYCTTGKRSGAIVKTIKARHPQANIFSLKNGLNAWME